MLFHSHLDAPSSQRGRHGYEKLRKLALCCQLEHRRTRSQTIAALLVTSVTVNPSFADISAFTLLHLQSDDTRRCGFLGPFVDRTLR